MICCKGEVERFRTEGDSGTHVGYHCHGCNHVTVSRVDYAAEKSEKKALQNAWHDATRRFLGLV